METDLPPVEWLVEPLIGIGDRAILYGESTSMKSWLLLDLAIHVAAGRLWLKRFTTQKRRVLYIDEEMNERLLRRRIRRLGLGAGLEPQELEFRATSQIGLTFDETGAEKLLECLRLSNFDPDVIIIETLIRVLKGNENDAEAIRAFWRNVEPLRRAGKTLIVTHHMKKRNVRYGEDNRDRARGSTDIIAGADTAVAIHRHRDEERITIMHSKSRNCEELQAFCIRVQESPDKSKFFKFEYEGTEKDLKPAKTARSPKVSMTKEASAIQAIRDIFIGSPHGQKLETGEIIARLRADGIRTRTAQEALKCMEEKGEIDRSSRGIVQWIKPAAA